MKNKKPGFAGGLLIYIIVALTLIFVALAFWWHYLESFENSRPLGVMDKYMTEVLEYELEQEILTYSIAQETGYQSKDEISSVLAVSLGSDRWRYAENTDLSTDSTLVYTLYCDEIPVGEAVLTAAEAGTLDMGFAVWDGPNAIFDFSTLGKTMYATVPYGCEILLNGEPVNEDCVLETIALYPQLEAYEDIITVPNQLLVYEIGDVFVETAMEFGEGFTMLKTEDNQTIYALPVCDDELAEELIQYCKDFVDAYVEYTENSNSLWALQQFLVPECKLYEEITQSSLGLDWGSGVHAVVEKTDIKNFVYYGNVITCTAAYSQTRDDGARTDTMDILLQKTDNGWRVLHITIAE